MTTFPRTNAESTSAESVSRTQPSDLQAQIEAISRSQAVIEFDMEGRILTANDNFLTAMGDTLHEVAGQHHRMFIDPTDAASDAYREFWATLNRGELVSGEFMRLSKGGRPVWLQAA